MQHTAEPGDPSHEVAVDFPDVRFLPENGADDADEFVGRERLVISQIIYS